MHFSIWELALILVIVLVLFGGSRLRNLGSDLGSAIRGFRDAMKEGTQPEAPAAETKKPDPLLAHESSRPAAPSGQPDLPVKDRDRV